jgi:hypothetical protein
MTNGTKICGCMGCRENAFAIVEHDEYGRRALCRDHAEGQKVMAEL